MTRPCEDTTGPDGQDRAATAVAAARRARRLNTPAPDTERPGATAPAGLARISRASLNAAIGNASS